MRAFVAIELEKGLAGRVKEMQDSLKQAGADVKFVEPGNLHFTVKFLGEIAEKDIEAISNSIEGSVSGFGPFKISIEGLSSFGSGRHVNTLFLDVKEGRAKLQGLLDSLGMALEHVRPESHTATPHLTIGRVRSGRNMELLLEKIRGLSHVKVGEMDVKFVKLKQSILAKAGPIYSDLKVFELRG